MAQDFDCVRHLVYFADFNLRHTWWEYIVEPKASSICNAKSNGAHDLLVVAISCAAINGNEIKEAVAKSDVVLTMSTFLESGIRTIDRQGQDF